MPRPEIDYTLTPYVPIVDGRPPPPVPGAKLRCAVVESGGFFHSRFVIDTTGAKVFWRYGTHLDDPITRAVVVWRGQSIPMQLDYLDAPGYERRADARPGYPDVLPAYASRIVAFNEDQGRCGIPGAVHLSESDARAARAFALEALLVLDQAGLEGRDRNHGRFPLFAVVEDGRVLTLADFGYTADDRLSVVQGEVC
jgi:hypothetical protein